jgi:hypothetical protein
MERDADRGCACLVVMAVGVCMWLLLLAAGWKLAGWARGW